MRQSFLGSPRDCLVVGAAFVIGFFVSGTARLSGLLFVAFLERYHVGREKASIPFIVSYAISFLSGPIAGYLGAKFGPRSIVLAGCFLAATGVGVCFFAEDFLVVIISWGGIYGAGYGFGCALVPKILSEHFPKHFNKANGLYLCSMSIAGIILQVLEDYSIKTYGVSGSFLILSSALLHTIPAAMILATVTTNPQTSIKEGVQNAVSYRVPEIDEDTFVSTKDPQEKVSHYLKIPFKKNRSSIKDECDGKELCYLFPEGRLADNSDDVFISTKDSDDKRSSPLESLEERPLAGYLAEIFTLKSLTLAGCFISSLGVGLCYFAEDIVTVTILFGVIFGVGLAFGSSLMPQILKQHFNKNLAYANGFLHAVSNLGSFALIPVTTLLLKHYDVSGALLLLSGIMLHGVPVAVLLSNPKYKKEPQSAKATELNGEDTQQSIMSETSRRHTNQVLISNNKTSLSNKTSKNCSEPDKCVNENSEATSKSHASDDFHQTDMAHGITKHKLKRFNGSQQIETTLFNPSSRFEMEQDTTQEFNSFPNVLREDPVHSSLCRKQNKFKKALHVLRLLKDPTFLVIMFCQSIISYVIKFMWTTIIEISRDKEIPQSQEQYILMFPLLAETAGYTCLGWVTDKGYLSVSNYMAFCFLLTGFSCFSFVLANNFFTLMVANMAFALCISGITIAFPSLIYEFVEEKWHTMAIASKFILYTPLSFTLIPLIGYFRGTLGSYDGALFLLTASCIVGAALLALLPHISKCQKQMR